MSSAREQRRKPRAKQTTQSNLRVQFQKLRGLDQLLPVRLSDMNPFGCSFEVATALPLQLPVTMLGYLIGTLDMQIAGRVVWCEPRNSSAWRVGIEFIQPLPDDPPASAEKSANTRPAAPPAIAPTDAEDHYEILQLSPKADPETIHRVYRILAARYHPDNLETGDTAAFRRLHEAYATLADPVLRAAYDIDHQARKRLRWKIFHQPAAAQGKRAERAKRQGILSLLYTKRIAAPDQPAVALLELEDLLGVPREHLEFSLWFLKESGYLTRTDNGKLAITLKGVLEAEAVELAMEAEQAAERRSERLLEDAPSQHAYA